MGKKKTPSFVGEFQSLIGRFVTLDGVLVYYIEDFSTFAEITQCFSVRTHKDLQTLRAYIFLRATISRKNPVFTP